MGNDKPCSSRLIFMPGFKKGGKGYVKHRVHGRTCNCKQGGRVAYEPLFLCPNEEGGSNGRIHYSFSKAYRRLLRLWLCDLLSILRIGNVHYGTLAICKGAVCIRVRSVLQAGCRGSRQSAEEA